MLEWLAAAEAWLIAESAWLAPLGGIATVFGFFKWPRKTKPTEIAQDSIDQMKGPILKDGPALTVPEFIRLRRELKADLEDELARADETEKSQLHARIAELESQIANPDAALKAANERITDLEALLDRSGNEIGGDRINEAKAALEKGDYSLADDIFAEIEARNDLAVQESARAAFGRGEVAEAEIRWADAADHYVKAAKRHETFDHLRKASEFLWRAGRYKEALHYSTRLVIFADENASQEGLANALNENALHLEALGAFPEAEAQYGKALEIVRATIGEAHPKFTTCLNNLAGVIGAQGRYAEAEGLFRDTLKIDRATIGDAHPKYATHLNNFANIIRYQERYDEAEGLFRDALKIGRATIGEAHPAYAIRLNNLAGVVEAQGRYDEAEGLYRDAMKIDFATIGDAHPDYAIDLNNLAGVLVAQGKHSDARPLFEQALEIFENTLPPDHPSIAIVKNQISNLPPPEQP